MSLKNKSRAATYDLLTDFKKNKNDAFSDTTAAKVSPAWVIAVVRLGKPLSYSRKEAASKGSILEGAFTRKEAPLIISDDCVQLTITNSKRSHTKMLSATLKHGNTNYLSHDGILPGDWVLAWITNNMEDHATLLTKIANGEKCNGGDSGLKFVGRAHAINKNINVNPDTGLLETRYDFAAIGFHELDTELFYDFALATNAAIQATAFRTFMAQIGLDYSNWAEAELIKAGQLKDNADQLISTLLDIIVGKGISLDVNDPIEQGLDGIATIKKAGIDVNVSSLKIVPIANKEAPFAYLVPKTVGNLLGLSREQASKGGGVFGYADILQSIIGVQAFNANLANDYSAFSPIIDYSDPRSTATRQYTNIKLKGTFLPVNPTFVNRPLWDILRAYLNPAINDMYTALKYDPVAGITPTLVVRQIPFSTESIEPAPEMPLTKFLALPRWKISPLLVQGMTIGRNNATRANFIHIYGEADYAAHNMSITKQVALNPPIFDAIDAQRSGLSARMMTVNCHVHDQISAPRSWMEAVADWSIGSQYTFNGTMELYGIQSPICEGDNVEFEGVAYHVEGVIHKCFISERRKQFRTTLELSNGMPVDQSQATADFPVYPGFQINGDEVTSDEEVVTSLDPGIKVER